MHIHITHTHLIASNYSCNMPRNVQNYACECPIIPRIMLAKTVTYNSQNYAHTLGSGIPSVCRHYVEIHFDYKFTTDDVGCQCAFNRILILTLYLLYFDENFRYKFCINHVHVHVHIYVTGPAKINHVSTNYTELYYRQYL